MTSIIEVAGVSFRYPGAQQDSLHEVNLRIERGDFVAVVGGNGSGKTTLCKTFNGLIPHYWSGGFEGTVRVAGTDTAETSVAALSHLVGYVYQDFGNQLVRPTVYDEVSFGPINFGLADYRERTEQALELLGISSLARTFVWQLSGGQQHLVALASVLAMRPEVIVVDEPVAELDPARALETYQQLTKINTELGTTIVVIEHHAEFVARFCRSVVLMADGTPQWHLGVAEALDRADELAAHGIPAPQIVELSRLVDPGRSAPLTVTEAADRLRDRPLRPAPTMITERSPDATPLAEVIAALQGVRHGYKGVDGAISAVIDGLDLELHAGERIALVGSNGAGKSTLLKLLTGLKVARQGEVIVNKINTRSTSPARMADQVSYLAQRPEQMFLCDSVRADIAMFPRQRRRPDTDQLVDEILTRVRLDDLGDRDGRMLSGGQQRRATLGIGLAMTPTLLLLDEPTSSLDVATRDSVIAMLADLADRIRCVVVATHDMHLVAEWADRVIVLGGGRVLRDTTPAELFADPELMAAAHLVPPQIAVLGATLGLDPIPLSVAECAARFDHDQLPATLSPATLSEAGR